LFFGVKRCDRHVIRLKGDAAAHGIERNCEKKIGARRFRRSVSISAVQGAVVSTSLAELFSHIAFRNGVIREERRIFVSSNSTLSRPKKGAIK